MATVFDPECPMSVGLMATKPIPASPEPIGTAILGQLADLDARSLTPEMARELLKMRFDASHQRRVRDLSDKAREGTLSPSEREDLDEAIRAADLLAILQSKARRVLKDPHRIA
jgi:hypothetical protein